MIESDQHKNELKRLAVLYWLGFHDTDAVRTWAAEEYVQNVDPDPNLSRLQSENQDVGEWLSRFAKSQLNFVVASHAGVAVARDLLVTNLQQFLDGEVQCQELCSFVNAIDSQFLDAIPVDDSSMAYYPEWLGNLWNCCDYCNPTWTTQTAPHLVDEAKTVLARLTQS